MGEPFENSEAWKSARVLTNQVYALGRREPLARDYGLRDQLQRAAVSVMNNVAEGWRVCTSRKNGRLTTSRAGPAEKYVP